MNKKNSKIEMENFMIYAW